MVDALSCHDSSTAAQREQSCWCIIPASAGQHVNRPDLSNSQSRRLITTVLKNMTGVGALMPPQHRKEYNAKNRQEPSQLQERQPCPGIRRGALEPQKTSKN